MINIGIIGSRRRNTEEDKKLIEKKLLELIDEFSEITIISGGCPNGGDFFAEELAKEYNIPIIIFKADWNKYGKWAGFVRNTDIAQESNILLSCVAEDRKGGTEDTIKKFNKFHKGGRLILV